VEKISQGVKTAMNSKHKSTYYLIFLFSFSLSLSLSLSVSLPLNETNTKEFSHQAKSSINVFLVNKTSRFTILGLIGKESHLLTRGKRVGKGYAVCLSQKIFYKFQIEPSLVNLFSGRTKFKVRWKRQGKNEIKTK
jgi:hypothetical protein